MSELKQPQIIINGRVLTPEQVGTLVAGLDALTNIASALDEARGESPVTDLREARMKKEQPRAAELRSIILGPASVAAGQAMQPGRVQVTIEIDADADRQDAFMKLWHEFVTGRSPQEEAIRRKAQDRAQGIASLRELVEVAQGDSGQCRHIAHFLAALYNGPRFPFDLTDLRCIDNELWEHCMAVLRLDQHPKQEVHTYFSDGSRLWEESIIGRRALDRRMALNAALLLAGYLQESASPELKQLAVRMDAWRRAEERDE